MQNANEHIQHINDTMRAQDLVDILSPACWVLVDPVLTLLSQRRSIRTSATQVRRDARVKAIDDEEGGNRHEGFDYGVTIMDSKEFRIDIVQPEVVPRQRCKSVFLGEIRQDLA